MHLLVPVLLTGLGALLLFVIASALRAKLRRPNIVMPSSPDGNDDSSGTGWQEAYVDGCQFAEAKFVRESMADIHAIQDENRKAGKSETYARAFHAKLRAAIDNAQFCISDTLPADLQVGLFQPGKRYRTRVRFSNASGTVQPDTAKDLRGAALRVLTGDGKAHDFLMTNGVVSHARDARQFMDFAKAGAGSKLLMVPKLIWKLGPLETVRMLKTALGQASRPVQSLATEQYWSRAPYAFGRRAVKFTLAPLSSEPVSVAKGPDYLAEDFAERLKRGPIVFEFQVQLWTDNHNTPIEDGAVEWNSPFITVAHLHIPQQDLTTTEAAAVRDAINKMEFNPWNTTDEFRPLGSMNRARKLVYKASAGLRNGKESNETRGVLLRLWDSALIGFFHLLNKVVPWHKLPKFMGALNLLAFRKVLKSENLQDTDDPHATMQPNEPVYTPAVVPARTADGTFNDLNYPRMGCTGARFGRNVPREYTHPDLPNLMNPSPREISRKLLRRKEFVPAGTLNLLAAAWIQFQVHDWFFHEIESQDSVDLPLAPDDDWDRCPMKIRRTARDNQSEGEKRDNAPPTYRNREPHWWDGSQIYGRTKAIEAGLRTGKGGMMKVNEEGRRLLLDPTTRMPLTGFTDNWWFGLYLMHTLFTLEHNAIAQQLAVQNPYWTDQQLFDTARLVNVALMAKIHTVEWTTAILAHPALDIGMNANWWGLATEKVRRMLGRISPNEAISGIPGSPVDHDRIPYSLTEEFVAVYRMHPLIPDSVKFFSTASGKAIGNAWPMQALAFHKAQDVIENNIVSFADAVYSFGIANPGAITLHNIPDFLRDLSVPNPDGTLDRRLDLAATDIFRDRERGVPRYNKFRQLLHRPAVKTYEEITEGNKEVAAELREMYGTDEHGNDRVDLVDLMIGMYAEPVPAGFGFSDTAFRVFILMASRRLESDRFFTTDFTPEVYTQAGMDWVQNNGFASIVRRHCPELVPALRGVQNPFAPWKNIAAE